MLKTDYDQKVESRTYLNRTCSMFSVAFDKFAERKGLAPTLNFRQQINVDCRETEKRKRNKQQKFLDSIDAEFPCEFN